MNHSHTVPECTTSRILYILPLYLLLVLIGTEQSAAQNESGRRTLSRTAFAPYWYDSATHKYHLRVPIIRTLPPLSSDMPANVLRSYIHLDSLARFNTNNGFLQSGNAWLEEPELLKKTLASYYTVMDYEPLRYQQYEYETSLKRSLFRSELGGTTTYLPRALTQSASIQREKDALRAVIFSDYVLRIRVLAVDSMPTGFAFGSQYVFNVTAEVLDTIKGQRFYTCQEQDGYKMPNSMATSALPSIYFQYYPSTYEKYSIYDRKEDSTFIEDGRGFAMRPGQEAVAFLNFVEQKFDSTHDAFELFLGPPASDMALPIINGQVRDRNLIWSDNMTIRYADWRLRFIDLRDKILNGTY